ncbi:MULTISPECIES: LysR family transcriptional regulator [Cellulomonas]|uniref:DNA-binding transcriptional LysR family regulator n=1 Tax=Cellulomonas iranensis TaxID=76862 RepID=A0ABU0GM19_9CELL|nr:MULTISPECIES: LysR family transcriptional regulator [Cellulomonas]MDQ0426407.1 DNA-binding transcriptional LysR family regulator [Cellulomonas iranensis]TFH74075.1 LysR family transcriptional regulator [Cellulomonas sp. HD19AZ1]
MPTLAQLRVLVGVCDHASFTDAAAALGVSQSGVSHAIAALEKEAGGRLVERAAPARPTGLGERLLPHARAALASVDAFVAESAARRHVGTVRLAAVPTVCQGLLPGLLQRWSRDLPDVRVQVFEGADDELVPWLEQGTVDAAVLVDPAPAPPGSRLVARDDFRALVRADHPLATEPAIDLAELHEDGLLVSAGGCEPQVRQMHADAGLEFRVAQRVHELATMIRMVAEGIGVSVMPALGGTMLPPELTMRPLRPGLVRELVLSGPQHRPWHPLVHALVAATDDRPVDATHR